MVVLTLSEDDMEYIISLLRDRDDKINLIKSQGTLQPDVCDRLIKRNSGVQSIFETRMIPYKVIMTDLDTKETFILSFKEFESYFGEFPRSYNESDIMNHIMSWCLQNKYSVEFSK